MEKKLYMRILKRYYSIQNIYRYKCVRVYKIDVRSLAAWRHVISFDFIGYVYFVVVVIHTFMKLFDM